MERIKLQTAFFFAQILACPIFFLSLTLDCILWILIHTRKDIIEYNKTNGIMANKRDLKKTIGFICSDIFAEAYAASLACSEEKKENIAAILSSVIITHNDFVRRISHPEPGLKQKAYYKAIISDFNKQASELIDQIVNLG